MLNNYYSTEMAPEQYTFPEESSGGWRMDVAIELFTLVVIIPFCSFCFLQCFDTIGWVACKKAVPLLHRRFVLEQTEKRDQGGIVYRENVP